MTCEIDESAETLLVVMCALALLTALLAWRTRPMAGGGSVSDAAVNHDRSARLTELREHLDREFITAARTLAAVSPGTLAALRAQQSSERIMAAARSTARYLDTLRESPPGPWQLSACYSQGRAIGLSLVQIQDAALAAARYPHDEGMAVDLAGALASLEQAVANLQLLTAPPSENSTT